MNLAPIGVSTYKRKTHIERTLRHLAANKLAKDSELYIFSDYPRPGDEKEVAEVRRLIKGIQGFKKVHVIERETNDRVFNNRGGITSLLDEFGRCIFLEEDIVTAPTFLNFINEGLEFYRDKKDIFAICGYTPPLNFQRYYKDNAYICRRFSAWGFGIWKDRYESILMENLHLNHLNTAQLKRLKSAGNDLIDMAIRKSQGTLEALDVRINFTMAKIFQRVVCPTVSLTNNTGHDGTGIHCGINTYFETELDQREDINFDFKRLKENRRILMDLFLYRGRHTNTLKNRLLYHFGKLDWDKNLRSTDYPKK